MHTHHNDSIRALCTKIANSIRDIHSIELHWRDGIPGSGAHTPFIPAAGGGGSEPMRARNNEYMNEADRDS
ncbi:protein of unknown function [Pararobbsia alpina]